MALVLRRGLNERIIINDNITIEVAEIRRGLVRLSIDAPPGVTVHREEVWKRIQAEKQKA